VVPWFGARARESARAPRPGECGRINPGLNPVRPSGRNQERIPNSKAGKVRRCREHFYSTIPCATGERRSLRESRSAEIKSPTRATRHSDSDPLFFASLPLCELSVRFFFFAIHEKGRGQRCGAPASARKRLCCSGMERTSCPCPGCDFAASSSGSPELRSTLPLCRC